MGAAELDGGEAVQGVGDALEVAEADGKPACEVIDSAANILATAKIYHQLHSVTSKRRRPTKKMSLVVFYLRPKTELDMQTAKLHILMTSASKQSNDYSLAYF